MSRPVHPLGFETENLPLTQLRALADALTTICNVASGLQEWSIFTDGDSYTEAGRMIKDLRVKIGFELDAIHAEAKARRVTTRNEADAKFDMILASYYWAGEQRSEVVAKLAQSSADLDWQLLCGAGEEKAVSK
jgi:hypothetical protein